MGSATSGTPPAREKVEAALKAVASGQMSLRKAAKHFGVCRDTLAAYRDGAFYRRKVRRCPECGHVVSMPCVACSVEVQRAHRKLEKRRRAAACRRS